MSNSESFTDPGSTSVFYQGVESERERIVCLLINVAVDQDALLELNPTKEQAAIIETVIATTYQLIELIKGEQK
jgi:hypothetical protein